MTEHKQAVDALAQLGEDFDYMGPDEFAKYRREDYAIYKEMARLFKK
jgi:hypothetical protein